MHILAIENGQIVAWARRYANIECPCMSLSQMGHKNDKADIKRVFKTSKEILMENLSRIGYIAKGQLGKGINRTIDIVNHMSKGLCPVYNERTGRIMHETWLEF